ncbi:MAG: UdgX family uracil-DNA binding protein [Planctomycetaceae bacterium]|nr:UdgX family uracil-DNA binding protein [Planctomycetaceae bacterium]
MNVRASSSVSAADFLPPRFSLKSLRAAAAECRACPLYKNATQTVFGRGAAKARLMIVGETPGDKEDLEGEPFVGPAGRLLDEALAAAHTDRKQVYVTNAVKHFKWEPRGTRRLHKKPSAREESACRPWLKAEFEVVRPHVILCLGATAAQALLGRKFRLTRRRGEIMSGEVCDRIIATYHPSAVLRAPDTAARRQMHEALFADVKKAVVASHK